MKLFLVLVLSIVALSYGNDGAVVADASSVQLAPRTPFRVPLARINVAFDNERQRHNQVKIYFNDSGEHYIIAPGDDSHVRRNGQVIVYREQQGRTFLLSDFEATTISQVCRTLISTLEIFENILRTEDWGRARYLDSYFPRFLQSFHVMICAAKDSPEALPRSALVREEDFDVSLNSPKSDARINMWQTDKDRIMKLRIAAQELIAQTKKWQNVELNNAKRNRDLSYSGDFDRAFTSFVRNYFGYVP